MKRRSIRTVALTLMVAVMAGVREAPGTAPPPPILETEEVEWLAEGLGHDLGFDVVFEDQDQVASVDPGAPEAPSQRGVLGFARSLLRWATGRQG